MRQLPVVRCSICGIAFLFESSLDDHMRVHATSNSRDLGVTKVRKHRKIKRQKRTRKRHTQKEAKAELDK